MQQQTTPGYPVLKFVCNTHSFVAVLDCCFIDKQNSVHVGIPSYLRLPSLESGIALCNFPFVTQHFSCFVIPIIYVGCVVILKFGGVGCSGTSSFNNVRVFWKGLHTFEKRLEPLLSCVNEWDST